MLFSRRGCAAVATILGALVVPVVTSSAALAQCPPDGPTTIYKFTNVSSSSKPTNLHSDYIEGPATVTYTHTATATVSASMTATVSAEAGIIFAKASSSLGVTVGASYSKANSWSYTKPVPSGKTGRLTLFHDTRVFTVTKQQWNPGRCTFVTAYSSAVNAPLKSDNANVWKLEYR